MSLADSQISFDANDSLPVVVVNAKDNSLLRRYVADTLEQRQAIVAGDIESTLMLMHPVSSSYALAASAND